MKIDKISIDSRTKEASYCKDIDEDIFYEKLKELEKL